MTRPGFYLDNLKTKKLQVGVLHYLESEIIILTALLYSGRWGAKRKSPVLYTTSSDRPLGDF